MGNTKNYIHWKRSVGAIKIITSIRVDLVKFSVGTGRIGQEHLRKHVRAPLGVGTSRIKPQDGYF